MSNVIQFLETMGSNPALTRFSSIQYEATVASLNLGDAQRSALLERDHAALNKLLKGPSKMLCLISTPIGEDWQRDHS